MPGDHPIRILHLSDFHFRASAQWDAQPLREKLIRFLATEVRSGLTPDLVALTGDLAFSGTAAEYSIARRWLDELWKVLAPDPGNGLPRDRLLLVPGNHDVDRSKVDIMVQAMQDKLLSRGAQNPQDMIAEILGDDRRREAMTRQHADYLAFYSDWLDRPQQHAWWQRLIDIRGQKIHCAGLDSTWVSWGDQDRGRLLLGRYQIHKTLLHEHSVRADWRLVLMHHPLEYLAEYDSLEARQTIRQDGRVLLRGHLHLNEDAYVQAPDPNRSCLEMTAGCVYNGSKHPNSFRWIELYPQSHRESEVASGVGGQGVPRRVRILYRAWIKGRWDLDRNESRSDDGAALFQIPALEERMAPEPDGAPAIEGAAHHRPADRAAQLPSIAGSETSRRPLDTRVTAPPTLGPYPGLSAFEESQAKYFFGRKREEELIIGKLARDTLSFLLITGPSGSGKSSLARAGILAALRAGALADSGTWGYAAFRPSERKDDPLLAMAYALCQARVVTGWEPEDLARRMADRAPFWADLDGLRPGFICLLVDQLEEVYSRSDQPTRTRLFEILRDGIDTGILGVVATLRDDFLPRTSSDPDFVRLQQQGTTILLGNLGDEQLHDMLVKPADLVQVTLEPGLEQALRKDFGKAPGALPLLAFTMERLYEEGAARRILTNTDYETIGGLAKSIETRANHAMQRLAPVSAEAFEDLFAHLVTMDDQDVPTRRTVERASLSPPAAKLAEELSRNRLLVGSGDTEHAFYSVAHEAVLDYWPKLRAWIIKAEKALKEWRQLDLAVSAWLGHNRDLSYVWSDSRIRSFREQTADLRRDLAPEQIEFLRSEQDRSVALLLSPNTSPQRRLEIGDRLALIGDQRPGVGLTADGIPDIDWVKIPGGRFGYQGGTAIWVPEFYIARYPVTNAQYQAFIAAGGYAEGAAWWEGLADYSAAPLEPRWHQGNRPRERVSWYEAVAFTRWLSSLTRCEIALPTEIQWERAARGDDQRIFPWGNDYQSGFANIDESLRAVGRHFLKQTAAVGLYPHAASPFGVQDLAGNLWEWCLNAFDPPHSDSPRGVAVRALRGGCWNQDSQSARCDRRFCYRVPDYRYFNIGFRLSTRAPFGQRSRG